jgi:ERCC4-related helicase
MKNALLEQYGLHKLHELRQSPYSCLMESNIEQTPHQIEAFVATLQALKNGGIILADEVGLGKTIEAGLVLKYLIKSGAKRILIAVPAPLRKQWQDELEEKFNIKAEIPESKYSVQQRDVYRWNALVRKPDPLIVIMSYQFAPWFIKRFSDVKWDYFVFDEAHRLRNLGNGAKMPKLLFDTTRFVPKVMLTATPLQNNLRELYALSQYIDERIFSNEKMFNELYVKPEDFKGLRKAIAPILHRTLRKDVAEYLTFSKRDCMAVDFKLSHEEAVLYQLANNYLQRPVLYAISSKNNALVKMVVRKLLASSSYAVVETFEVLKKRLKILKENTRSEKADVSLKAFFNLIEDDDDNSIDDVEDDDIEEIERERYRAQINDELVAVEDIIKVASQITSNSKSKAVLEALSLAFEDQKNKGFSEKALIFTESKRTQKYLVESLITAGYDGIVVFNGEMSDPDTKKLYNAWKARNPKRVTNTPSIDLKQAIVEQFEHEAKILVATDAASEGLNLQFCDTVINYDLPWNPMKIEQRIGRCHRFGQKRDVWVYNLLNTENAADARVYEILNQKFNLFKGVFGASDEALGLLESGTNFEKKVMGIYERCKTASQFKHEFDRLEREIASKRGKKANELKQILTTVSSDEQKKHLATIAKRIEKYIEYTEQWTAITEGIKPVQNTVLQVQNTEIIFDRITAKHGYIFTGSFMKQKDYEFVAPILIAFDETGKILDLEAREIIQAFKEIPKTAFITINATDQDMQLIGFCHDQIVPEMMAEYEKQNKYIIEQNGIRVKNWIDNQREQYKADSDELRQQIAILKAQKNFSKIFQEKIEIQKKIDRLEKQLSQRDEKFHDNMLDIEKQAEREHETFIAQFVFEPVLLINLVVKF